MSDRREEAESALLEGEATKGQAQPRVKEKKRRAWLKGWAPLEADPRTLALFRITLGFFSLCDLMLRWPAISLLYSNRGVQPNHYALFTTPKGPHGLSLLYGLQSVTEVQAYFIGTAICLIAFILGWRTRFFHLLCALLMVGLHNRNMLVHNGGDVVHNLVWFWTLLLPLGRRWSLDALRQSLARPDPNDQILNAPPAVTATPVRSLAVLGLFLQFSAIYFFNTVHKHGATWADGEAIYYMLAQDRIINPIGLIAREWTPLWVWSLLTYGTLVVEGIAPLLILSPLWVPQARLVAFVTLVGLHLGIAFLTNLGLFSWWMVTGLMMLIRAEHWDALGRWWGQRRPKLIAYYDGDCGVCTLCARVGARLAPPPLIRWDGALDPAQRPGGESLEAFQARRLDTIIVYDPERDARVEEHRAIAAILAQSPLTVPLAWLIRLSGPIGGLAYRAFARRRHQVSDWLGFGLCGLPRSMEDATELAPQPTQFQPESRIANASRRAGRGLAELFLLFALIALSIQVAKQNPWMRRFGRVKAPEWSEFFMRYGDLRQGWRMFAPDAPKDDGWMVIELELGDGRIVDPRTGETPNFEAANGQLRRWHFYNEWLSNRMRSRRNRHLWKWYEAWWRDRGLQRGMIPPGVEVKGIKAWWVGDSTPAPAQGKHAGKATRSLIYQSKAERGG
ncbi:MAG: DCC1-like thiol-disulfide oxidoreductase family protein [Myxococcota bacterium]|nr:DCC1-like thiol-disulfide oxidoreductase family protein [Myxococcota bacterium]